jgi:hypothetical protein
MVESGYEADPRNQTLTVMPRKRTPVEVPDGWAADAEV